MLVRETDGSVSTRDGRLVCFSIDRFVTDIAEGNACFICGATPSQKPFNNEHVIPDWILKAHKLHSRRVAFPNKFTAMYGRYKIPCCVDCNGQLSETFERPISEAFAGGHKAVSEFIKSGGRSLVFRWLALIFLKTQLKDRELRWHLDPRHGDEKIADLYDWAELHHIHCLVRSFYSGARLTSRVYGSLAIMPAGVGEGPEYFDYGDLFAGRAMLLRLGDTALITVLNDSGAVMTAMRQIFQRITEPLSMLQLREMMVLMGHCNMQLQPRPRYTSELNPVTEEYVMDAELPRNFSVVEDCDKRRFGELLYSAVGSILESMPDRVDAQALARVRGGHYTFLFDEHGKFLSGFK